MYFKMFLYDVSHSLIVRIGLVLIIIGLLTEFNEPEHVPPIEITIDAQNEVITIVNNTDTSIEFKSWCIVSVNGNEGFVFPSDYVLNRHSKVKILSGNQSNLHGNGMNLLDWTKQEMWNDKWDKALLYNDKKELVASFEYGDDMIENMEKNNNSSIFNPEEI